MRRDGFRWCRRARRRAVAVAAVVAITAGLATTSVAAGAATPQGSRARSGGTVTYAVTPGNAPDNILPFIQPPYIGFQIENFIYPMYLPLYWFDGKAFTLNEKLSLAYPPKYNATDTSVTVKLKPWYWSDGEKVSPNDIAFFMGLVEQETANWWGFTPGFFPTNVASSSYNDKADTFTFHLKSPVNPTWFTDNQLSIVQPMPLAWDLSGPGKKADCSAEAPKQEATACPAVFKYLAQEDKNTSTYASNPLWQVVDGPFRLSSFSPGGTTVVLVPNKKYSGPDKPKIAALKEETFTSDAAEYDVLRSGKALTVGYVPFADVPTKPIGAAVGANPVPGYTLDPWFQWANNFIDINFNNPTTGPIEHQLYFRQALQELVDQQTWIRVAFHGYAYAAYGPVPVQPVTPFLTHYQASNPYPFSTSNARRLLTSHGWTIPATGPATCTKPGTGANDCGAGIPKGRKLSMSLVYASGTESLAVEMEDFQSDARKAGLYISLRSEPIGEIFALGAPCTPKQSGCSWQALYYGGPASEEPYWFPDNGLYFICHSGGNAENYCNSNLDAHYPKVYSERGLAALYYVENFETRQAILLYVPVEDAQLTEVSNQLGGYTQSGTAVIEPQNWYFKS